MKGENISSTVIGGDFNTPLSSMKSSSRQKIKKEAQPLNDTLHQMYLIAISRPFHPKAAEYTFFSCAHRTFFRIDHILSHKSSLDQFQKIEMISSIISEYKAMRLDFNDRKKKL